MRPADTTATFNIPTAGTWNLTLVYFQDGGGSDVDLSAAQGSFSQFTPGTFQLIGDTADGGLTVASTPAGTSTVAIGTNVASAMQNVNSRRYVRIPFTVTNPSAFNQLQLSMLYNDGFVAYLNGVEVASANAPATLAYNSTATAQQTIAETATPQIFGLSSYLNLLQAGTNVLAIQGLNSSASDSSFLVLPELIGSNVNTAQVSYFVTPTPGAPNASPSPGVAGTVTASVPDGYYTNTITVTLSDADARGDHHTTPPTAVRPLRRMARSYYRPIDDLLYDNATSRRPSRPATSRCLRSHGRTFTWPT